MLREGKRPGAAKAEVNFIRWCEIMKLLSSPAATLPERFAVFRSSAPYGFDSRTAVAWLAYTKQLLEKL
ncbi:hypothetical protein DW089_08315 [Acidaminococcus sp. AM05-11]|nr:hypothetical protein DW089_08315 [Acidaminococcus sp. AM05-11]